jgi:hypothetical protein
MEWESGWVVMSCATNVVSSVFHFWLVRSGICYIWVFFVGRMCRVSSVCDYRLVCWSACWSVLGCVSVCLCMFVLCVVVCSGCVFVCVCFVVVCAHFMRMCGWYPS